MRGEREGNIERVRQWRCCAFRSPPSSERSPPGEGRIVTRALLDNNYLVVEKIRMVIFLIEKKKDTESVGESAVPEIRIFPIPKKNIPGILVFGIPRSRRPTLGGDYYRPLKKYRDPWK